MSLGADPIAELAGIVSECRDRSEYEAGRLAWLSRMVGFEASYFGAGSPEEARAPSVSGVDAARVSRCEENADRYWADRLTLQRAAITAHGAIADHDALSARARDRMPFYREVVSGHGIRATAIGILSLRGQVSGSLFLGRTARGARFGAELWLLRRALPVLALGEAVHLRLGAQCSALAFDSQGLTPREQAVLGLLCRGWTNAQIAAHLGSSPRTVKNQVSAILRKTKTENRTELTAAVARGRS